MTILGDIGTHRLQRGAVWDAVWRSIQKRSWQSCRAFPSTMLFLGMQKFWVADTPAKFNIDTKNSNLLKGDTSSKPSFFVSMLDFRGCHLGRCKDDMMV